MPERIQQLEEKVRTLENALNTALRSFSESERERQRSKAVLDAFLFSDRYLFQRDLELQDGRNIQLATGTGSKFGTATNQKLAFFGVTPVVQQASISSPSADAASLKTAVDALITRSEVFGFIAEN